MTMLAQSTTARNTPNIPDFADAPEWQRKYLRGDALYALVKAQAALITDAMIDQAQAQAEEDNEEYSIEDDYEFIRRGGAGSPFI